MAYGLFLVIFSYPSARTRPYAGDGGSTTQGHNQFNPQESLNFVKILFIIVVFFSLARLNKTRRYFVTLEFGMTDVRDCTSHPNMSATHRSIVLVNES